MIKILMVQPKGHETFWQLKTVQTITKRKGVNPPLGLATLAALTPPEYEITIIDEYIDPIDFDVQYDIVAITGYTIHATRIKEISEQFMSRGILTVGGGPWVSSHTEEAKEIFSVVIRGEAEVTWPLFLDQWKKSEHESFYNSPTPPDLSCTPAPRWDLVKLENYSASMVQTSRGCPHICEFCDVIALFGRKVRLKPIENVLAEIRYFAEQGRPDIFFADDNFIGNRKYARDLLVGMIELNKILKFPLRFATQITVNVANDDELLELLIEANFFLLIIGVETPSEESLKETNKGQNLNFNMGAAIQKIQSRGIFLSTAMIVGFDNDGPDIFQKQFDFLSENFIPIPIISMLSALKGTELYLRMIQEERLIPGLEAGDMCLKTNIIPKNITKEELENSYAKLFSSLYTTENFYERFSGYIDQLNIVEVKRQSPVKVASRLAIVQPYYLGVTVRLLKYYIFHKDKKMRVLFRKCLKKCYKRSMVTYPLMLELLIYFKAHHDFIQSRFFPSEETSSKPVT